MKILHVLDMAGVGSIISKYQTKIGHKSGIIYHQKNNLSSSISEYYRGKACKTFKQVIAYSTLQALSCDIVHIHSAEVLVPLFKLLGKKVVLHYHGSDIKEPQRSQDPKRIRNRSRADLILYNDESMLPLIITNRQVKKRYLHNPVDTYLFKNQNQERYGALGFLSDNLDKEMTRAVLDKYSPLDIIDISKEQLLYFAMPNIFNRYEQFIDVKVTSYGIMAPILSTSGLQALACGCSVINNGKTITSLPESADPYNCVKQLDEYYKEIL